MFKVHSLMGFIHLVEIKFGAVLIQKKNQEGCMVPKIWVEVISKFLAEFKTFIPCFHIEG
jgi:hypothetical protein